jgi:hypothetical protein
MSKPLEVSSKIPTSRKRQIITLQKQSKDPRFSSDAKLHPSYQFIHDLQKQEIQMLKAQKQTPEIQKCIQSKQDSLNQRLKESELSMFKNKFYQKQKQDIITKGKKPFYLGTTQLKQKFAQEKLAKESPSKLENMLEKARKRRAQKLKTKLPFKKRSC